MSYLNHVTLSTGHITRSPQEQVSAATLQTLTPWIIDALQNEGVPTPLPGELGSKEGFKAIFTKKNGALTCTVFLDPKHPLFTFGVAPRSRQAGELWASMCMQYGSAGALVAPSAPWCAVALHPALIKRLDVASWAGDFERCVAWAWVGAGKFVGDKE